MIQIRTRPARAGLLAGGLLALTGFAAAQTVHVVDGSSGPGHDFTTVTAAVDAAADGDVLLIRQGDYLDFVSIRGKTLVLQAEAGADVSVFHLTILDLAAQQFVAVRGVDTSALGMNIQDNDGVVWIEDGDIEFPFGYVEASIFVEDSRTVVFRSCRLTGVPDSDVSVFGPPSTLIGSRSAIYLFETEVLGFDGIPTSLSCGSDGFAAVAMQGGSLWLYGSTLRGGDGFNPAPGASCGQGRSGGAGVVLRGALPSRVQVLDSSVSGGSGGLPSGPDGVNFDDQNGLGTVLHHARSARSHVIDSPSRAGDAVQGRFLGEPGEPVWLLMTRQPGRALELSLRTTAPPYRTTVSRFRNFDGPLLLSSFRYLRAGSLDGSGTFVLDTTAPDPAPAEALVFFAQGLHRGASGWILSSPTLVTFLDPTL